MEAVLERNHVKRFGNGTTPVVLAHGFGCSQSMWQYLIPLIDHLDIEIITFDYVGAGTSQRNVYSSEKYNSLNGYKQDVLDVLVALNLKDYVFVGHSISGMIGMLAAIEQPNLFSRLVMIGASSCYINSEGYIGGFDKAGIYELLDMMEMNFSGWAKFMAPFAMQADEQDGDVVKLESNFNDNDPAITRQFAEVTFMGDYRNDLNKLSTDTYLIQCAEDSVVPIEAANYLHQHIKSSVLCVLDAKGHYPQISHPVELAELLSKICKGELNVK